MFWGKICAGDGLSVSWADLMTFIPLHLNLKVVHFVGSLQDYLPCLSQNLHNPFGLSNSHRLANGAGPTSQPICIFCFVAWLFGASIGQIRVKDCGSEHAATPEGPVPIYVVCERGRGCSWACRPTPPHSRPTSFLQQGRGFTETQLHEICAWFHSGKFTPFPSFLPTFEPC